MITLNHAQMEGFQYLLKLINEIGKTNYSLFFSYKGFLMTGKFYKESQMPNGIKNFRLKRAANKAQWYDEDDINKSHLLFQVINQQPPQAFFQKYNVSLNLDSPEILFMEIYKFVGTLKGDPVSKFIYDIQDEKKELNLPFIMTDLNAIFEPVSLIDKEDKD